MKKNLLRLLICFMFITAKSQTWAWARAPKGTANTECVDIAVDQSGNSFNTGYITSGNLVFGSYSLTTSGQAPYIAKYDASGNGVWAKSSSTGNGIGWGVGADAFGNSFITGEFFPGNMVFGSYTLTNINTGSNSDIYVVKYDPSGNLLWARSAGGSANDVGRSICADASGNIIVSGEFGSPTITFGSYTLTNSSARSVYLVKYDLNGNVLWAKSSKSKGWDIGFDVSSDNWGNIFVTGEFDGDTISFGPYSISNMSNLSAGPIKEDMFIAKYSTNGTELWAKNSSSSILYDRSYSVAVDNTGDAYVTGYYNGNMPSMSCSGFTSKYDPGGNLIWTKYTSAGSSSPYGNIGYSVASFSGGVLVGGAMSGSSISFGTTTVSVSTLLDPLYLVHYDASGNVVYAKAIESGGDDNFGVAIDNNCNFLVTSDFQISTYILGTDTLKNTGGESIFIAKLNYSCQGPQSIKENSEIKELISIFPNPTGAILNIKSEKNDEKTIEIINAIGQVVLKKAYSNSVDVSFLPQGCYIIKVLGDQVLYSRFIKE